MSAALFVPQRPSMAALREAAANCRGCELWEAACQTVFGEGPRRASIVMVGEQPGDREDVAGRPFVGPAGRILDDALEQAGIARRDVYLTNAVKHFRWTAGNGKRRLHKRPTTQHIRACGPWLAAELDLIRPAVTVALGAVALQSLVGSKETVSGCRGRVMPSRTIVGNWWSPSIPRPCSGRRTATPADSSSRGSSPISGVPARPSRFTLPPS